MIPSKRKTGQLDLQRWMWANADRPFTNSEAAEAIGWSTSSTSGALRRLHEALPEQLEHRSRGVYVWRSSVGQKPRTATSQPSAAISATNGAKPTEEFTVTVIGRRGDHLLVQSSADGELYRMERFDFQ